MPLALDPAQSARIAEQARRVSPAQVAVMVLTFLLSGIGWLAAQAWFGLVYAGLAIADGWQEAHEKQVRREPGRTG